jgi:acetate kinase
MKGSIPAINSGSSSVKFASFDIAPVRHRSASCTAR